MFKVSLILKVSSTNSIPFALSHGTDDIKDWNRFVELTPIAFPLDDSKNLSYFLNNIRMGDCLKKTITPEKLKELDSSITTSIVKYALENPELKLELVPLFSVIIDDCVQLTFSLLSEHEKSEITDEQWLPENRLKVKINTTKSDVFMSCFLLKNLELEIRNNFYSRLKLASFICSNCNPAWHRSQLIEDAMCTILFDAPNTDNVLIIDI